MDPTFKPVGNGYGYGNGDGYGDGNGNGYGDGYGTINLSLRNRMR